MSGIEVTQYPDGTRVIDDSVEGDDEIIGANLPRIRQALRQQARSAPMPRGNYSEEILGGPVGDIARKSIPLGPLVMGGVGYLLGGPLGAAIGGGIGYWISRKA